MEKAISLRLPEMLYADVEKLCKLEGFASLQEFIREAIRSSIKERELKKDIKWLRSQMGTLKHRPTQEEMYKAAEDFINSDHSDIIRKYGLDKVRQAR